MYLERYHLSVGWAVDEKEGQKGDGGENIHHFVFFFFSFPSVNSERLKPKISTGVETAYSTLKSYRFSFLACFR